MTKQQILYALEHGINVYWMNKGYEVYINGDDIYTRYIYNDSCCGLQASEYKDCFILEG